MPKMPTQCPQKHEYTEENTYVDKNGYRHCKTCRRERMRARRPATGIGAGGKNAAKTHCPRNHEYTEENTSWQKAPTRKGLRRVCRACARINGVLQNTKRYGITPEDVERMLEEQDFQCLICSRKFGDEEAGVPHIDHDHSCCPQGKSCGNCVRGLLCVNCNQVLGKMQDNPIWLRAAANYLESRRLVS